jgi:hypothetical protein
MIAAASQNQGKFSTDGQVSLGVRHSVNRISSVKLRSSNIRTDFGATAMNGEMACCWCKI